MDAVARRSLARRAGAALASALLLAAAFPPVGAWWLAWLAPVPLYLALTAARSLLPGFVFGLVLFAAGMHWMNALAMPLWAALAVIQGLFFAAFGALVGLFGARLPAGARPFAFAAGWVLFEWVRSLGLYAFPWFLLATSQATPGGLPWLQIVAVTGQWGLSFALAAVAGLLGEGLRRRQGRYAAAAAAVVGGLWGYGGIERPTEIPDSDSPRWPTVAIVQGNEERGADADPWTLYEELTRTAKADLVLWPEGAVRVDPITELRLAALARRDATPLLVGAGEWGSDDRPRNWALLFDARGTARGRYLKQRLAPFGEVYPLRRALPSVYAAFGVRHDSFVSGDRPGVLFLPEGRAIGTLICYESAFPWVARGAVRDGAETLAFLTSDQTFDGTVELEQHLQLAIVRAVETRRWALRAASTGISALIAPDGEVRHRLAAGARGVLAGAYEPRRERTPFVRYGDWFVGLCVGLAAGAVLYSSRFQRSKWIVPGGSSAEAGALRTRSDDGS